MRTCIGHFFLPSQRRISRTSNAPKFDQTTVAPTYCTYIRYSYLHSCAQPTVRALVILGRFDHGESEDECHCPTGASALVTRDSATPSTSPTTTSLAICNALDGTFGDNLGDNLVHDDDGADKES